LKNIREKQRKPLSKLRSSPPPDAENAQKVDNVDSSTPVQPVAKSSPKLYFNSETQEFIVKFQGEEDRRERDKIYIEKILPAFEKLVENLINIHKFTGMYDTYDDLKNDCINFLFETIHKFDPNRGTNAFSYFNVVAKNWLIIRTKQKAQKTKRMISINDHENLSSHEVSLIEEHNAIPSQDEVFDSSLSSENTLSMLYDIRSKIKTENELTCINSIITIFENIDGIDLLNKSAILLYMRELSGLSPKQLTTTMQSIKKYYKRTKLDESSKKFF